MLGYNSCNPENTAERNSLLGLNSFAAYHLPSDVSNDDIILFYDQVLPLGPMSTQFSYLCSFDFLRRVMSVPILRTDHKSVVS